MFIYILYNYKLSVSNGFRLDVVETLAYFYDSNIGREVRLNGNQTSVGVATTAL